MVNIKKKKRQEDTTVDGARMNGDAAAPGVGI